MALTKIISGGQTGADQAGLAAAKLLGLETGGTAPFGYRTDEGPARKLLRDTYGLKESLSREYAPRTIINVRDADGTVVFGNLDSPGSKLTIAQCIKQNKPVCSNPTALELVNWVKEYDIHVLNVAGNRESTNHGIYDRVRTLIIDAFTDDGAMSTGGWNDPALKRRKT
jgi:hypothetical protein